jgi:hypothetical protein
MWSGESLRGKTKNDPLNHTKRYEKNSWFEEFRVFSWILFVSTGKSQPFHQGLLLLD